MSVTQHYVSNLRDIFFNLFEVLDVAHTTYGQGRYADTDEPTARETLTALEVLASRELAASFAESDRVPLKLDAEGNVTLPEGLTRSIKAYFDGGWNMLELPAEHGGFGAPPSLNWAAFEMIIGANPCVAFYLLGNFLARIIDRVGTDDQRARYLSNMIERHWGGTMVLTEPDAGSDVGAALTRARHVDGEEWELTGTKRFITNGDFDFPENIVHLVLARPEGASEGTRGLSMFIVPKRWVEADGSLGDRNGVVVSNLEKKMGLQGSATCDLTFGLDRPCRALLVGNVHDGIRQMFHVIEHARMAVGVKSMSTLSTAYFNALAYARERVQGHDLALAADKTAPRIAIIHHPDVRRMLMLQKAFAEGLRAMILYTAWVQDQVELHGGHRSPEARPWHKRNDLLLPLIKGYASEKVYELLAVSLQVYGGSGYLKDYPIEQYIRDQKIDTLYEGTTHIQALDLFFRKVGRDQGTALRALLTDIQTTLDQTAHRDELAEPHKAMTRALADVQGIFMTMLGKLGESVYHVGLQGNRVLFALAELVIGWRLLVNAAVALDKLPTAPEVQQPFYRGKLEAARFYGANVLPHLTASRKIIEASTLDLVTMDDASF